jgi:dolichol-phosphate mannosyltransferase
MGGVPTTCIVVPTYNESQNVAALVAAIEGIRLPGLRVLFVDDASPDGTSDAVRSIATSRPWVGLLQREKKLGLGSAYQDGFRAALAEGDTEIIVEMDADLQHPASVVPLLVDAIRAGADVAIASRYTAGGGIEGWSWLRRTTSRGANAYSRVLLRLKVRDATSGLRAFTRRAAMEVASAKLPAKGYEFQVAALHQLRDHAKMIEVPYVFGVRAVGKSKLGTSDVVRFFFTVLRIAIFG